MEKSDLSEDKKNELLRMICDKSTLEAIDMLKLVNKNKCDIVKDRVIRYFEENKVAVNYETYKQLIDGINNEPSIYVQHRNNLYELADIEDSDY